MKRTLTTVLALLAAVSLFAAEQAAPAKIRAVSRIEREHALISVPVTLDVTGADASGRPAVLCAYVVRAEFDPEAVVLVRVAGGATKEFGNAPASTIREKANKDGVVRLAAAQTNTASPMGEVNVARLLFREIRPGGAKSIKVRVESAASAAVPGLASATLALPVEDE